MTTGVSRPAGDVPGDFSQAVGEVVAEHPLTTIHEARVERSPYSPSWVDRLTCWVDRLPVPAWAFYLALGLVLSLGYMLLLLASPLWASGVLNMGGLLFYGFLNGLTFPYLLGLVHYLDRSAVAALSRFRPAMKVDEARYHELLYQLTTLPARPTLLASALGVAYAFAILAANILTVESLGAEVIAPLLVLQVVGYNVPVYVLVAVLVYHTVHQLRMVNTIYTQHTRINLFRFGPLYALSGLAARTAIGIAVPTYVWFQANSLSATGTTLSDIIQTIFLGIMVVVTFVWPLLGAHGLLEREKQRLQDEVARRIESTIASVHHRVDNSELRDLGEQKEALNVLVAEQGLIAKLRTWPWRTETVSGLGLTFLLPILVWVVQRVLERLGF